MPRPELPDDVPPAPESVVRDGVRVFQAPVQSGPEASSGLRAALQAEQATMRAMPTTVIEAPARLFSWRWFITARPVNVAPLAAFGAALLLLVTSVVALQKTPQPDALAASSNSPLADDARVIRFTLNAPEARTVALVGDFNGWDPDATIMYPRNGNWSVMIPVTPGRHQYGFVVDGTAWLSDPVAARAAEEDFGSTNSILYVGG